MSGEEIIVSVKIMISATYECSGPTCRAEYDTTLTAEEFTIALREGKLEELEPGNLPVGWIHVLANPAGVCGIERWSFCSVNCLTESLDLMCANGITRVMRGGS
jgi:hypothetical protein